MKNIFHMIFIYCGLIVSIKASENSPHDIIRDNIRSIQSMQSDIERLDRTIKSLEIVISENSNLLSSIQDENLKKNLISTSTCTWLNVALNQCKELSTIISDSLILSMDEIDKLSSASCKTRPE